MVLLAKSVQGLAPMDQKESPQWQGDFRLLDETPLVLKCLLVSGQASSTARPAVSAQMVPYRGSG